MKKLLTLFAIALAVVVSSCSKFDDSAIWDKLNEQEQTLNDHEKRIAALEELCKQMNTNINALQTLVEALEKRDYITNVSPVREDGVVVGYTISFASSDTITIYNGKDGKDGVNGQDGQNGYTPQIGVMKDTDGIYYWTLDGEWLLDGKGNKIKAVGEDGRDGQDGTDGTNGSNGSNGQDGQDGEDGTDGRDGVDGITPRLKIENDYWYVSYDEGASWIELGRATGEDGADGSDGSDGDSIFSSVTQDEEYVYFNLADGTMITLPKHDKENIQFEDLQVKAICCKNWDTNNDGELSYAEAAAVTDIGTVFKGNTNIIAFTEFRYFTGLTFIHSSAFYGCSNLWKVALPEKIERIGDSAFRDCTSISKINFPSSIKVCESSVFYGCNAISVDIDNMSAWCEISFSGEKSNPIFNGGNITINGEVLTNIHVPNGTTGIGNYAFYKYIHAQSFVIPDSVESIGKYAFYGCSNLQSVTIGSGVVSVGTEAFNGATGVLYLNCSGGNWFEGSNFTEVIIGDNVTSLANNLFYKHTSLKKLKLGKNVIEIGDYAFQDCSSLQSGLVIPASVRSIGNQCFRGCVDLDYIYIMSTSPCYLGDHVFYSYYSSLTSSTWRCLGTIIYVPMGSEENYRSAWNTSNNKYAEYIVGYDFENNVEVEL